MPLPGSQNPTENADNVDESHSIRVQILHFNTFTFSISRSFCLFTALQLWFIQHLLILRQNCFSSSSISGYPAFFEMASKSTVFLLLSAMSHLARTQHVEGPQIILSCAEVNCPTRPKVASNMCTVTNTTYSDVGVVKIQGAPSSLPGLTWVEAIAGDDTVALRWFIKDFYFAADL